MHTPKSWWDPEYTMPNGDPPIVRPVETVVTVTPQPKTVLVSEDEGTDEQNTTQSSSQQLRVEET